MSHLTAILALAVTALLSGSSQAATQTPPPTPTPPQAAAAQPADARRLRVYLDCSDCFRDYLRDEINWVDFVRQPQDADVTILSSSQSTGGGGREVVLRFVGAGRFADVDRELRALSLTGEPENLRRRTVLRTVSVGLLGYLAAGGLPAGLDVEVDMAAAAAGPAPQTDPWNLWVFRLSADASLDAEESNRESRWSIDINADRVTDHWKLSFGAQTEVERQTFDLDEDDPFKVTQRERTLEWFAAKSLGPHWSFGVDGNVESSTFGNTRFSARTAPAIEFSVFPYREYATRQLVMQYQAGIERAKYNEITLFDKLEETLWRHEFSARLDQRQPWGSLQAGAELSQYLHDRGKYRLEVNGEIDLRITRGLSLNLEANASRIRDQLSLPRRDATPEEVLLRLRELQSGYEVGFSFGISYSFGSIFNNVVNPRFGGG